MVELIKDLKILLSSMAFFPPWLNITSIIGGPGSWFKDPHSELNILKFKDISKTIDFISSITIQRIFPFRKIPGSIPQAGIPGFENEVWFFVNGIATNKALLELNGDYLRKLFRRSIELINNPTDGIIIDLIECIFGRTYDMVTEPAQYTLKRIESSLKSERYDKVILIGHSQGGIILSNVVKELVNTYSNNDILTKLEVYTFASAADEMKADENLSKKHNRLVPYIEHYANTMDFVAKMGICQRLDKSGDIMDGELYTLRKKGHLLNAHYLSEFQHINYSSNRFGTASRLYGYLNGGRPSYYNPL